MDEILLVAGWTRPEWEQGASAFLARRFTDIGKSEQADVVQDIEMAVVKRLTKPQPLVFSTAGKARAYLFRALRRRAVRFIDSKPHGSTVSSTEFDEREYTGRMRELEVPGGLSSPLPRRNEVEESAKLTKHDHKEILAGASSEQIEAALNILKPASSEEEQILRLVWIEGLNTREAASRLGMANQSSVTRAVQEMRLRAVLPEMGQLGVAELKVVKEHIKDDKKSPAEIAESAGLSINAVRELIFDVCQAWTVLTTQLAVRSNDDL